SGRDPSAMRQLTRLFKDAELRARHLGQTAPVQGLGPCSSRATQRTPVSQVPGTCANETAILVGYMTSIGRGGLAL
ncbi:MAG: hypothetical protein AAFQ82_23125, partial [Myxococcota bacterium]